MVIAESPILRSAWRAILTSLGLTHVWAVSFTEAIDHFRNQSSTSLESKSPSILIADVDLQKIEQLGPQPTKSEIALDTLQRWFPSAASIPTLCINDVRVRRSKQEQQPQETERHNQEQQQQLRQPWFVASSGGVGNGFKGGLQQQPETTPLEECQDPFETIRRSISKPFKNSSLIEVLRSISATTTPTAITRKSSSMLMESATISIRKSNVPPASGTTEQQQQQQQQQAERLSSISSSANYHRPFDLSHVRTLLVDDNPINRKVVARMLDKMNIKSQVAENGRQAYEAIEAALETDSPFQLVFMDVWMPEMNGLEAAAKIRHELTSVTPTQPYIIAMTACVMPGDKEKCIDAGMNGYVSKPIRKEELDAAIHTFTQLLNDTANNNNNSSGSAAAANDN
ncbi:CheY-like superfamily [Zychaea mexicana]|uniref:CheY-like superfamily n=1 Tax=Zychaea mexicana TaxID=64656 RepID=UPI0022FE9780|nr:CheY-like superfamily [Zychaea mexicana]KAI9489631.1 CheY-like superfamily [Zychaea mexicana]